jgi:hypothetical protein
MRKTPVQMVSVDSASMPQGIPIELFASYLIAIVFLFLYAASEFGKRPNPGVDDSLAERAVPNELTSGKNYLIAFLVYVLGLIILFVGLCII